MIYTSNVITNDIMIMDLYVANSIASKICKATIDRLEIDPTVEEF